MHQVYYLSRSALESGSRCNLNRFLEYDLCGRGIKPIPLTMPLATGAHTHKGCEFLLKHIMDESKGQEDFKVAPEVVDKSVEIACDEYRKEAERRGFVDTLPENLEFTAAEQVALVEALVRAFAIQCLPNIIKDYEIVAVEREEILSPFHTYQMYLPTVNNNSEMITVDVVLMSRVDAILKQRRSSDYYLLSLKTTSQVWGGGIDQRQEKSTQHDMQGIVETLVVEERLRSETKEVEYLQEALDDYAKEGKLPAWAQKGVGSLQKYLAKYSVSNSQVAGVIPVFLIKGRRYKNDWENRKENYSPLIRAWKQAGVSDADSSYAWSYKWTGEDGKGHTLGKGWKPVYMWEQPGGVKEWVERLSLSQESSNGIVEPVVQSAAGYCLPKQIYVPTLPIDRNSEQIERWKRQTIAAEEDRIKKLLITTKRVTDLGQEEVEFTDELVQILDVSFPQNLRGCHYPGDCKFVPICHGTEERGKVTKPIGAEGGYWWRKPHHEVELKAHEERFGPMLEAPETKPVQTESEWEEEE